MKTLASLWKAAHKLGAAGTQIADTAVFGTRSKVTKNAGTAGARRTPRGSIGKHSVWEGPRQIPGGAPVLRREKIA